MQKYLSSPNAFIGDMVFQAVTTGFPIRNASGMTVFGALQEALTLFYLFGMILDEKVHMTPRPAPHTRPVLPAARQRVLIVDDESAILFAYRKLIELEGFGVDTCENLFEAMAMIRTRPYLAIITDMRLQGTDNEDGIELLHFIREMQPDARVMISTGYGNEELRQTTQTLGASHYFEKPVRPSQILTALKAMSTAVPPANRMDLVDAC